MKIILSVPAFHNLVTSWIRQSVHVSLLSFCNVLDIHFLVYMIVLPSVMPFGKQKSLLQEGILVFRGITAGSTNHSLQGQGYFLHGCFCLATCVGLITILMGY